MCGIVGIVQQDQPDLDAVISKMAEAMFHRGPDDGGTWSDRKLGVAFGQRRLSILDLSEHGHQPMHSPDGRHTIVYNGEVYNYGELTKLLVQQGQVFQGSCDTEVVLSAIAVWGIERALLQFNGMFAFALVDRKERLLHLGRDRIGIKPLYFGWNSGCFFFSSELKPLHRHPRLQLSIDRSALALFMRHNYVPAPYSIYEGVYKLLPGCSLTIPIDRTLMPTEFSPWPENHGARIRPTRYWCPKRAYEAASQSRWQGPDQEAIGQLETLLKDSVRLQMISDVPLGVLLSGGIDSTTVTAMAQSLSTRPIKTFSIGFDEPEFDEAPFARAVANHLKTDHTELYVRGSDALDVIPKLPAMFDEPFSDSSQIPMYLVSHLARKQVTVALSGDGGDELFCGYNRYPLADIKWNRLSRLPASLRACFGQCLKAFRNLDSSDRFLKYSGILQQKKPQGYYPWIVAHWKNPFELVRGSSELLTPLTFQEGLPENLSTIDMLMYLDTISYLPDDLLVKGDRASMAVSLEVRVPILDHRVVEFAWRLPISMKRRENVSKWILKQVLYRYVPASLIDRPKKGFSVPVAAWLRGPLRDWAEDLLSPQQMESEGYLNSALVQRKWLEHIQGKYSWDAELWDVLMFQAWLRTLHAPQSRAADLSCESFLSTDSVEP